jgi:hypothetical protein
MKANAYVGHNDFLLAMLGQCSVSISSAIQLTCEAINIHRPVSHWKIPPPPPTLSPQSEWRVRLVHFPSS